MSRIETTIGIVARTKRRRERETPATSAIAAVSRSTLNGPVQPRTPNATSALESATTDFVNGFSERYVPVGTRRTYAGRPAALPSRFATDGSGPRSGGTVPDEPVTQREPGEESRGEPAEDDEHDEARDR